MKIATWKQKGSIQKGMFITLDGQEALEVIASLAEQLSQGHSCKRKEWTNTPVGYFSIGVDLGKPE